MSLNSVPGVCANMESRAMYTEGPCSGPLPMIAVHASFAVGYLCFMDIRSLLEKNGLFLEYVPPRPFFFRFRFY